MQSVAFWHKFSNEGPHVNGASCAGRQVEVAHGGARSGRGGSSARGYGGGFGGGITRRSDYRVLVTGLPKTASWQDLKDHMRKAGDVTFAQARRLCLRVLTLACCDPKYKTLHLSPASLRRRPGRT